MRVSGASGERRDGLFRASRLRVGANEGRVSGAHGQERCGLQQRVRIMSMFIMIDIIVRRAAAVQRKIRKIATHVPGMRAAQGGKKDLTAPPAPVVIGV